MKTKLGGRGGGPPLGNFSNIIPFFFLTTTLTWSWTWTLWEQGLVKWLTKKVRALQRILMKKMLETAKHHPEVTFCLACWLAVKRNFLSSHLPTATLDKKSPGRTWGAARVQVLIWTFGIQGYSNSGAWDVQENRESSLLSDWRLTQIYLDFRHEIFASLQIIFRIQTLCELGLYCKL